jgi:arylsulfatase A-like enzyme
MIRHLFATIVIIAALAVSTQAQDLAGRRPNIIVIVTDDQGYGDVSAHGNPILKTPNLDRLHAEGVRFRDFHVSPTCSPTRSALMSGRHEFKNGVTHTILERERMSLRTVTLAQVLKSAGYTTGIFGKWHLGDEDAYQPDQRGFDEVFIHGAGGIGQSYAGSCGDAPGNKYFDPVIKHNGKFEKTTGFCTDVFTVQALQWIDAVQGKQPFFCYLSFNAPHGPLICPPEAAEPYQGKVSADEATFFGMIANIDDNVGRLLAKLQEKRIDEDTLVIFMNDNGGTVGCRIFNAGLRGQKGTAWEGGTRASSFWRWPGTLKSADVDRLTAHVDVFPTLAEIAGVKLSENIQAQVEGRSLIQLLKNPQEKWADRYFVTHVGRWKADGTQPQKFGNGSGQCSIRNACYSLVRGPADWQLFDLQEDPGQTKDIASIHPEIVRELSQAYDAWWQDVLPYLENEDAYKTAPKINSFREQYEKQFGTIPADQTLGKTPPH